jgi:hypothetical protein
MAEQEAARKATLIIVSGPDGEPRTVSFRHHGVSRELWAVTGSRHMGARYQVLELEWPQTPGAQVQVLRDAHRSFRSKITPPGIP